MSLEAVLKIGGSLSRGTGLPALCREIRRLGRTHPMVVVPGGGKFADQVRMAYRQYHLSETTAHHMALLAMDQYGYVLNNLIQGSCLISDFIGLKEGVERDRTAILMPSELVIRHDPLPNSWQVTSDTIAAWIARETDCPRLILLKDVEGLMTAGKKLIPEMTVEELARHSGGVDEYLAPFLSSARLEAWIINGNSPERLSQLLETGQTTGTRIQHGAHG